MASRSGNKDSAKAPAPPPSSPADYRYVSVAHANSEHRTSTLPCQPSPPAPQRRDLGPAFHPDRLAHKPAHPRPIDQLDLADAQRRGDAVDEAAEVFGGQFPDFHVNGGAAFVDAHHAGPLDRAAGEGVELVFGCGLHRAEQARAALGELPVERQAAEVRAADRDLDGAGASGCSIWTPLVIMR